MDNHKKNYIKEHEIDKTYLLFGYRTTKITKIVELTHLVSTIIEASSSKSLDR